LAVIEHQRRPVAIKKLGGETQLKNLASLGAIMKSLSLRIAERVAASIDASTGDKNRAAFILLRAEIQSAIDHGCSILKIWEVLRDDNSINFGYQAFRRYAHQLCSKSDG
jgi:hypothetical protein